MYTTQFSHPQQRNLDLPLSEKIVTTMDNNKQKRLNKLESFLYVLIVCAIISDLITRTTHTIIFIVSTVILVASIIGVISIGLIKLQLKQREQRVE